MAKTDCTHMHNEELIDLLFTEEDRLPRTAVDELIRRGQEIVPILTEIAMEKILWLADFPDWWAPVHATYLLGTIGGEETLVPLLSALRWSDAYDNDWVTEDMPSILGSLGEISYPSLISIVDDRSAGWSARSIAMDALGSQTLRFPSREEDVASILGRILSDRTEETGARRSAAYVLLDFRRADHKRALTGFAKAEENRKKQQPDHHPAFTVKDVERDLAAPRSGMDIYLRDWLQFYSAEQVMRRQQRWRNEDGGAKPDNLARAHIAGRGGFVIGRNDPCPCGSGKPYKRCCWRKLH